MFWMNNKGNSFQIRTLILRPAKISCAVSFNFILYSLGKYYLKIGHSDGILKEFLRHEDISNWHCSGGDPWIIDCLTKLLKSMFTGNQKTVVVEFFARVYFREV